MKPSILGLKYTLEWFVMKNVVLGLVLKKEIEL
jgi:hypothetical protein